MEFFHSDNRIPIIGQILPFRENGVYLQSRRGLRVFGGQRSVWLETVPETPSRQGKRNGSVAQLDRATAF